MRLSISKSKNAESLYIIDSFRVGNKISSRTVEKLGTIDQLMASMHCSRDDVISWAKSYAKELTEKSKLDKLDIIIKYSPSSIIQKHLPVSFNVGYLFLQSILYDLKINKICDSITSKHSFKFDLSDILVKLIYGRILSPSSKASTFDFSKTLLEQPSFDLHHIYRSLSILAEEHTFIQSSIYQHSLDVIDRNNKVLYYDCTNFFFEVESADGLKQYGVSKEHRPNPIVQMGLFMDGNGLPLAFCINPGNQNEQKSLKPLEKQIIKDFELSKFIVCTDAGLASKENRRFNSIGERSYIVTQSIKTLKKHLKDWALSPTGWKVSGSKEEIDLSELSNILEDTETSEDRKKAIYQKTYYKERWINEDEFSQRLVVSYSFKYRDYQSKIRNEQIERAIKLLKNPSAMNRKRPNDPKRFIEEVKEEHQETNKSYDLKIEEIQKEMRYDGYYGICTRLEDDVETILKINQNRWEIEESFRIMKTEFKSRPVHLSRDDRIIAHFMVCYLSLLVYRILEKKLDDKYTTSEIIDTLKKMNVYKQGDYGYIPIYERTDITDELHETFGFRTDYQIITRQKMKKIIKETKK